MSYVRVPPATQAFDITVFCACVGLGLLLVVKAYYDQTGNE
jgi:hypothetical protein